MSVRQLCRQTGKQPAKALFYFPEENKTGIAPTRIIEEDGALTEGRLVTVNWAGERVTAQILALGDDEEILNQKDLEWMKKNLRPENLCKEASKQPKKGAGRKQKRSHKRSCEIENEGRQQRKRSKKDNLPIVEQAPIPDSVTLQELSVTHQPVQQVGASIPSSHSSPLPECCYNFRSDLFDNDLPESSTMFTKLDQIIRNQQVMLFLLSRLETFLTTIKKKM